MAEKKWWVVRKRGTGDRLCTTHEGRLLNPDMYRCQGPYETEKEASDWVDTNCDAAWMCPESKCDTSDANG